MNIISLLILVLSLMSMSFYLDISFEKRTDEMIKDLQEMRQEMNKLSSISAVAYGQIIEEVKTNVDTDAEQAENS